MSCARVTSGRLSWRRLRPLVYSWRSIPGSPCCLLSFFVCALRVRACRPISQRWRCPAGLWPTAARRFQWPALGFQLVRPVIRFWWLAFWYFLPGKAFGSWPPASQFWPFPRCFGCSQKNVALNRTPQRGNPLEWMGAIGAAIKRLAIHCFGS